MKSAYSKLHSIGAANSVEVWYQERLVGGVYGVNFGGIFFAESMFFKMSNSSKVALFYLVERLRKKQFVALECQFLTEHLRSLGAIEISDLEYMRLLGKGLCKDVYF